MNKKSKAGYNWNGGTSPKYCCDNTCLTCNGYLET